MPVHVLPGNHDCRPGAGNWDDFRQLWSMENGCGATIDVGSVRLILLDTHGHSPEQIAVAPEGDPVYGWVAPDELARLENDLATAGERPVLLFTHQLLFPWSGSEGWQDYYGIENAQPVCALIERYGVVRAVFQAHAHRFDIQTVPLGARDTTFVVLPALIEYPVAWARLDCSATSLRVRLQPLPVPHLQEASLASGEGQAWRAGRPEWRDFSICMA
jgi:3',5'-cyclic AMP phosphodiesterase CpdA